jgi:mono/diheme cytochrome c family protein
LKAAPNTDFRRATAICARAVALFAPRAWADEPSPAELGRKTYTSYCARCHGFNLVMVTGTFDLRRFPQEDKERFVRSVSKGVRAMPAWEGTVKPEEIEAIWVYVGAVNGWATTREPK